MFGLKILGCILLGLGALCQAGDRFMTADKELKNYRASKTSDQESKKEEA